MQGKKQERRPAELKALCRRFEIAVANFGRSCASLKANEKAFQAWYAASVIQEFGMSRVYRELHLWKKELFGDLEPTGIDDGLDVGNELFPDLSVSWDPAIDARHSVARTEEVKHAQKMLNQLAIISELKVTGSTGKHTPPAAIKRDFAKLMVFQRAHGNGRSLGCYMVILDNAPGNGADGFKHHYSKELRGLLKRVGEQWDDSVPEPTTLLIEPTGLGGWTHIFRGFGTEPDTI